MPKPAKAPARADLTTSITVLFSRIHFVKSFTLPDASAKTLVMASKAEATPPTLSLL